MDAVSTPTWCCWCGRPGRLYVYLAEEQPGDLDQFEPETVLPWCTKDRPKGFYLLAYEKREGQR